MAAEYVPPRATEDRDDRDEDPPPPRDDARRASVDAEDADELADSLGTEAFDDDLTVIPIRTDEFRCDRCFLVHHRSRLVAGPRRTLTCLDCA